MLVHAACDLSGQISQRHIRHWQAIAAKAAEMTLLAGVDLREAAVDCTAGWL
jgi:hypothetical protein